MGKKRKSWTFQWNNVIWNGFCYAFRLPRSLKFEEIVSLVVDLHRKTLSTFLLALDSWDLAVLVLLYYLLMQYFDANSASESLELDYIPTNHIYKCYYFNLYILFFHLLYLNAVNSSRSFSNSCVTKCCDRISDDRWATLRAKVTTCDSSLWNRLFIP